MGLNYQDCKEIVEKITYKPNMKLRIEKALVFEGRRTFVEPQIRLVLIHETKDVNLPGTTKISLDKIFCPSDFEFEEDLLVFIFQEIILNMERHEAKEWFRINNKPVFDPHPELKEVNYV